MKTKQTALILAILLGCYGVHQFYCGNNKKGIIYLLVTLLSGFTLSWVVWCIGLYDAYQYYQCASDEEFNEKFVITKE